MSVDLLYPDNRNRGKRVNQLVTQITTIQSVARLNKKEVSDQLTTIEGKFPDVLKVHGLQSLDELKRKLQDSLPEELKQKYFELVKLYEEDVKNDNNIIDVIGLVIMASGGAALGAKMLEFVSCGKLAAALNCIIRALVSLATDAEAAQLLLKMAGRIVQSLASEIKVGETAMKAVKFVKAAGSVISVLGVFIDAILLIIAAFKGAEQRTKLEDAINDLAFRRMTAQAVSIMGNVYAQFIASMYTAVVAMKRQRDTQDIIDEACDDIQDGIKKITFDEVWDAVKKLDSEDSTTWDEKDPSKDAIKKWWDDGNDPTKYSGKLPDKHLDEKV